MSNVLIGESINVQLNDSKNVFLKIKTHLGEKDYKENKEQIKYALSIGVTTKEICRRRYSLYNSC